jgi:hypothetical protein
VDLTSEGRVGDFGVPSTMRLGLVLAVSASSVEATVTELGSRRATPVVSRCVHVLLLSPGDVIGRTDIPDSP